MSDKYINQTGLAAIRDWLKSRINTKLNFSASGRKATFSNAFANGEMVDIQNINSDRSSVYILANGLQTTNYLPTETAVDNKLAAKQDQLVSGTNIKTVNNQSLLGSGNIDVGGGTSLLGGYGVAIENGRINASNWIGTLSEAKDYPAIYLVTEGGQDQRFGEIITENIVVAKQMLFMVTTMPTHEDEEGYTIPCSINVLDSTFESTRTLCGVHNGNVVSWDIQVDVMTTPYTLTWTKKVTPITGIESKLGDLAALTTDDKSSLVAAINEVYEKSGEPFRVKQWASNSLNVEIPVCTEDVGNTAIPKMVFSIDDTEGASYQIVGMIAYEVFDAASGGNRINCWPVCQFTGNGQKELSVRWMCAGTARKTAKRINAWVLIKHR